MYKRLISIAAVVLFIFSMQVSAYQGNPNGGGLKEFIKYLNENQKQLGFNTYGLLEQDDKIDVKIYLLKEHVGKLKTAVKKFNFHDAKFGNEETGTDDIVVIVTFLKKSKPVAKQESELDVPVKKETKDTEETKIEKPLVEKKAEVKKSDAPKAVKKDCPRRVKVQVKAVNVKTFYIHKSFKLPLLPAGESEVTSEKGGVIKEIAAENDSEIAEGQVLLMFDDAAQQTELKALNEKLKEWKTKLFKRERWKVRSQRAEESAKRIIAETTDAIAKLEADLQNLNPVAPITGTVAHSLNVEDTVNAGDVIAKIVNSSKMKITVPAADASLFKVDDRINLKFDNISELYSGTVTESESGLIILIDNANGSLQKGMNGSFKVIKEVVPNALVIDSNLVKSDASGSFVYVVNGKRAKKVYVTVYASDKLKNESLIQSGLMKEDELIATNLDCIQDNKKIRVMVMDKTTGKLVKRGKVKALRTEEEKVTPERIEPEKEPTPDVPGERISGNFMSLSLGGGYRYIADSIFAEIYGNGLISGRFQLSYTIKDAIEIFAAVDFVSKSGEFTGLKDEVSMTMIPMYIGLNYHFKTSGKFKPYAGLAFANYAVKEKFGTQETSYLTDQGLSILIGAKMAIGTNLDAFAHIKYDVIQLTVEALENKLDISGTSLFFGISYRFKF